MNYYLKFTINDINFAAPIEEIIEIARPKIVLKQEKISKNIVGFFELRKKRLPIYDLPKFLELKTNDKFEVIVSEIKQKNIGFKVDKVFGIITAETITPFPDLISPKDYLPGLIKEEDDLVQVLLFRKVVTGSRLKAIKKYI
jgi:chemotaxis signal transduction protein